MGKTRCMDTPPRAIFTFFNKKVNVVRWGLKNRYVFFSPLVGSGEPFYSSIRTIASSDRWAAVRSFFLKKGNGNWHDFTQFMWGGCGKREREGCKKKRSILALVRATWFFSRALAFFAIFRFALNARGTSWKWVGRTRNSRRGAFLFLLLFIRTLVDGFSSVFNFCLYFLFFFCLYFMFPQYSIRYILKFNLK